MSLFYIEIGFYFRYRMFHVEHSFNYLYVKNGYFKQKCRYAMNKICDYGYFSSKIIGCISFWYKYIG